MDQEIINTYLSDDNMLLTGGAGTGKSYHIRNLFKLPQDHKVTYLTASTGNAAQNINGMTIHSFAGTQGYTDPLDAGRVTKLKTFKDACKRICATSRIIIDEVSMIRADYFQLLNIIFSRVRLNGKPFGGIQIILVGDFMQLPPVYHKTDELKYGKYVFETPAFREANFKIFNLKKVYRQSDTRFIDLLNNIRVGSITDSDRNILINHKTLKNPIYVAGINKKVDAINAEELSKLNSEVIRLKTYFNYESTLDEKERLKYFRQFIYDEKIPESVDLKINARVVVTRNALDKAYVNGSVGYLKEFGYYVSTAKKYEQLREYLVHELGKEDREYIQVTKEEIKFIHENWDKKFKLTSNAKFNPREYCIILLDDNSIIYVERYKAEIRQLPLDKHDTEMITMATASYYPIALAYALTTHKTQGMTLKEIEGDAEDCFDYGHFYVMASRATSLEGMNILNFDDSKIKVCPVAKSFYEEIEK